MSNDRPLFDIDTSKIELVQATSVLKQTGDFRIQQLESRVSLLEQMILKIFVDAIPTDNTKG